MAAAMSSENPDSVVTAEVTVGEFDPCDSLLFVSNEEEDSGSGTEGSSSGDEGSGSGSDEGSEEEEAKCPQNMVYMAQNDICYGIMENSESMSNSRASELCSDSFGEVLPVYDNEILEKLALFIKSGKIILNLHIKITFSKVTLEFSFN